MSSRASPAVLPDPKRPRLLASGDETSSTPAVPSAAPSTFTSANYPNLVPTPIQAVATHGRTSHLAMQTASSSSSPPKKARPYADPAAQTSYPPSSSTSSSLPPRPESGPRVTDADRRGIIACLRAVMPDIVIAASLDRTPREIQNEIFDLVRAHEYDMVTCPQTLPSYTPEDYRQLLKMHRRGESAERIALVLHRTTSSILNHFAKQKPIWQAAGEWVKPPALRRDYHIDYDERIKKELAGPAKEQAAAIAQARLAAVGRPAKVNLLSKFGRSTSARVVDSRTNLPTAAQTVVISPPVPSSTGFSAYSTAASLVPIASISSFSPAPLLVTKPVPTNAPLPLSGIESLPMSTPLPVAVTPPPFVKPVHPAAEQAASSAPPPTLAPVPTTTTTADSLDLDVSPLSPLSDDSPPSLPPRLPNPVPHHAPHLPLLPSWSDARYEQGMSGLKRFRQLMEDSRSRTRAAAS